MQCEWMEVWRRQARGSWKAGWGAEQQVCLLPAVAFCALLQSPPLLMGPDDPYGFQLKVFCDSMIWTSAWVGPNPITELILTVFLHWIQLRWHSRSWNFSMWMITTQHASVGAGSLWLRSICMRAELGGKLKTTELSEVSEMSLHNAGCVLPVIDIKLKQCSGELGPSSFTKGKWQKKGSYWSLSGEGWSVGQFVPPCTWLNPTGF